MPKCAALKRPIPRYELFVIFDGFDYDTSVAPAFQEAVQSNDVLVSSSPPIVALNSYSSAW